MNKTLKGVLLTLASALCWGLSGVSGECLIGSVEPISAAVFSAVFLGTDFTLFDIIGFVLIVTTVVILSFDKQ